MSQAILFPGQGAQFEGMGREWAQDFSAARETFEQANTALEMPLTETCWTGGDEVNRTDIAQPGIFTTSVAIVRVLRERGLDIGPFRLRGLLGRGHRVDPTGRQGQRGGSDDRGAKSSQAVHEKSLVW